MNQTFQTQHTGVKMFAILFFYLLIFNHRGVMFTELVLVVLLNHLVSFSLTIICLD